MLRYISEKNQIEKDLLRSRDSLNIVVDERTAELSESIRSLNSEVVQRMKAEGMLRSIIETATDAIISTDSDGNIRFFSKAAESMFGYSADEISGKPVTILIPEPFLNKHTAGMERLAATGETKIIGRTVELKGLKKDDRTFPIELSLSMWKEGDETFFAAIIRDITKRKKAEAASAVQFNRLKSLHTIDMTISSSFDLETTFSIIMDQLFLMIKADAASVFIMHETSFMLEHILSRGFISTARKKKMVQLRDSITGRAFIERKTIFIPDIRNNEKNFSDSTIYEKEGFVSYAAIPLISKGDVKGVLEVFHRSHFEPDDDWLEFVNSIVVQAAIAIDNTTISQALQNSNAELTISNENTIELWAKTLELKDMEPEGHSERVADMALRIGKEFGISSKELVNIRQGSLLHDIGKLGIPDSILLKPGKLTVQEWEIIKKHPTIAYNLLYRIKQLHPVLAIPFYHHEKWDGTGYPKGLKGIEIPIGARIFAVVDVWDSLSSDRPYRIAWPRERILEHIRSESGKHFDPDIVKIFLRLA